MSSDDKEFVAILIVCTTLFLILYGGIIIAGCMGQI
jgi:hypothetical protein